jgi:hypothetical protein
MSYMPGQFSSPDAKHIAGNKCNVYVYFQMCPDCKQPVIGIKEAKKDDFFY